MNESKDKREEVEEMLYYTMSTMMGCLQERNRNDADAITQLAKQITETASVYLSIAGQSLNTAGAEVAGE